MVKVGLGASTTSAAGRVLGATIGGINTIVEVATGLTRPLLFFDHDGNKKKGGTMASSNQRGGIVEFIAALQGKINENRGAIEAGLQRFAEWMENAAIRFQEAVKERSELYPKLRAVLPSLAKRGWFISGNFGMSEIMRLAQRCDGMAQSELDNYVADMYRSSFDEHGISLIENYPHRGFAIKPAIDAHRRGEYALSVPMFFAQAEGISFEALNKYIFTNSKAQGGVDENIRAAALERINGSKANQHESDPFMLCTFMEIMWTPFAEPLPVGYSSKDRTKHKYDGLNRNTVMHGLDLEYATEENSLKAFSMLSHVGALLHNLAAEESVFSWYEKT